MSVILTVVIDYLRPITDNSRDAMLMCFFRTNYVIQRERAALLKTRLPSSMDAIHRSTDREEKRQIETDIIQKNKTFSGDCESRE